MTRTREDAAVIGRSGLGAFALVAAVVLAYLPAIGGGFVWDDDHNVTANPALADFDGLRRIWCEVTVPPYYPLYHSVLWLGWQLWGREPLGYHLLNVLLHSLNALLVWRILRRLEVAGAWAAAAIFALHPVQVESVAWITELKNVLSATFYFAAGLAYLAFRPRWPRYGAALGLFLCALLTKTVTATLPVALLLVAWWKRGRLSYREDVRPTLPFFALGIAWGGITVWMEKFVVGAAGPPWSASWLERVLVAGRALVFYAAKLLWPHPIIFVYPRWRIAPADPSAWLYPLAVVATLALLWSLRTRLGRGPLVAALYFAATLAPALGFFDVFYTRYSQVADRWQYLASVGLIAAVVAALAQAASRLGARGAALGAATTALVLAGLGAATWRESGYYEDAETRWRVTLEKNPRAVPAHNNLGGMLLRAGELDEAERHFREAIHIEPDFPESHNNLGIVLHDRGRLDEAIAEYREALRIWPSYADAHNNLGISIAERGGLEEAEAEFREAVRLNANMVNAQHNLGSLLLALGRSAEAEEHLRRAAELDARAGGAPGEPRRGIEP